MNHLDLFSGIGGFSLGLERAGFNTVAFCEIEQFPRDILRQHWPTIPIYHDVRDLTRRMLDSDIGQDINIITAGFPCQDISLLNTIHMDNEGTNGARSGLWREALRLVCDIRPEWAVLENVAALSIRGLGDIIAELATLRYSVEWHCISVADMGGEHLRKRTWIIAHDTCIGIQKLWPKGIKFAQRLDNEALSVRDSNGQWKIEPDFLRGVHGIPEKLDKAKRIKAIGNSISPQIAEFIGRRIIETSIRSN